MQQFPSFPKLLFSILPFFPLRGSYFGVADELHVKKILCITRGGVCLHMYRLHCYCLFSVSANNIIFCFCACSSCGKAPLPPVRPFGLRRGEGFQRVHTSIVKIIIIEWDKTLLLLILHSSVLFYHITGTYRGTKYCCCTYIHIHSQRDEVLPEAYSIRSGSKISQYSCITV